MSTITTSWDELARTAETPWEAAMWTQRGQVERMARASHYLDLVKGDRILDYGCGTGFFTNWVPEGATYVGTDASKPMIERAKKEHPRYNFEWVYNRIYGRGYFSHVLILGTFNLASDFSQQAALDRLTDLWNLEPRTMVASLYYGADPRNTSFDPELVAAYAEANASRWIVDHHRHNDLMLVMHQ